MSASPTETFYRYAGEIAEDLDTPVIGVLPGPPPTCRRDQADELEAFAPSEVLDPVIRALRASTRSVHISGISGDVGRDAVLLSLARVLAETGRRILVVDADADGPPLAEPGARGLTNVLANETPVTRSVVPSPGYEGMMAFLPVGTRPAMLEAPGAGEPLERVLEDLRPSYDVMLVSAPCLDRRGKVHPAALACEAVVLVLSPGVVSRDRIRRNFLQLWGVEAPIEGLVTLGVPDVLAAIVGERKAGAMLGAAAPSAEPPMEAGGFEAPPTEEGLPDPDHGEAVAPATALEDVSRPEPLHEEEAPAGIEAGDGDGEPDDASMTDALAFIETLPDGGLPPRDDSDAIVSIDGLQAGDGEETTATEAPSGTFAGEEAPPETFAAAGELEPLADEPGDGDPLEETLSWSDGDTPAFEPAIPTERTEPLEPDQPLEEVPEQPAFLFEEGLETRPPPGARPPEPPETELWPGDGEAWKDTPAEDDVFADEQPASARAETVEDHSLDDIERIAFEAVHVRRAGGNDTEDRERMIRLLIWGVGSIALVGAVTLWIVPLLVQGRSGLDVAPSIGGDTFVERPAAPSVPPPGAPPGGGEEIPEEVVLTRENLADAGAAGTIEPTSPPAAEPVTGRGERPRPPERVRTPESGGEVSGGIDVRETPAPPPVRPATSARASAQAPVLASPRFTGRSFYAIHITSFRSEERAANDAKRLSAATGHPADYIDYEMTSGEKLGLWYRVVVGQFDDVNVAKREAESFVREGVSTYAKVFYITGP